jgi:hypothetical protein
MASQTRIRTERPLNVVLRPASPAEAAYRSAVLAPGFEPEPGLNLLYLGGKTIAQLSYALVHLGRWDDNEPERLDAALAAAMTDRNLNRVLAQYFQDRAVEARFLGPLRYSGAIPSTVYKQTVEAIVADLHAAGALSGFDLATTAVCLALPEGVVLVDGNPGDDDAPTSTHGLGGYHGSVHPARGGRRREAVYYAVSVYSEGDNGIVAFDEPWKNVCATLYHELQEVRTDPDVEDAIRAGRSPAAARLLGWYSPRGGEIGDIPMAEAGGDVSLVMQEVPLADGGGTVPVQLMWSNAVGGPEGPIARRHVRPRQR